VNCAHKGKEDFLSTSDQITAPLTAKLTSFGTVIPPIWLSFYVIAAGQESIAFCSHVSASKLPEILVFHTIITAITTANTT